MKFTSFLLAFTLPALSLPAAASAQEVFAGVLAHGVGAVNVDGCRVAHDEPCRMMAPSQANIESPSDKHRQAGRRTEVLELKPEGRWPANLLHDGSDEVIAAFPDSDCGFMRPATRRSNSHGSVYGKQSPMTAGATHGDSGSWVVLVHGYSDNAQRMWFNTGIAPEIAKHHRVVALDNRNHGQSDHRDHELTERASVEPTRTLRRLLSRKEKLPPHGRSSQKSP